jgi:outer membrane protein assembly factor BamE (lipoprotein component of BamABCDE complex)
MLRLLLLLSLPLCLLGCSNSHQIGQQFSLQAADQIRPGVTNKATVQQLLGPPTSRAMAANNEEQWVYISMTSNANTSAANYIPVVNMVAPVEGNSTSRTVQVYFKGDVVSRCWISTTDASASGSLVTGIKQGPQQNTQKDCGK